MGWLDTRAMSCLSLPKELPMARSETTPKRSSRARVGRVGKATRGWVAGLGPLGGVAAVWAELVVDAADAVDVARDRQDLRGRMQAVAVLERLVGRLTGDRSIGRVAADGGAGVGDQRGPVAAALGSGPSVGDAEV